MEKTNNKLLAVAEELQELDLLFASGSDLDVVEKGYARQLIHAISTENKVLKCEALKSLGDLYLQKAKMKKQKVENFHKACALYKEVLRYLRSKEERQVLQHRIRYAEKCTKLTRDQNRTKSEPVNSANVTLAVTETLQEVEEKAKMKGSDVIPLIEGYTNAFVEAIVDRDNRLKTESLKSLGDLYLEKGRVGRDEAAFTKAAGLYRAALDRCEDSDGRETLKHRIKYAEKVKEKVKKTRQEPRQPRTRKAGSDERTVSFPASLQKAKEDSDSTYQDQLQEGCRALQTGNLDRAEEHFAAALKAVHVEGSNLDQHWKEAEPLYKLGEVYLKRGIQSKDGGDFTKAAALCNAALVRSREENRDGIKQTIQKVTRSFIKHVFGQGQMVDIEDAEKHTLMLKEDRNFVEREIKRIEQQADPYSLHDDDPKIREVEEKRAEAIKALCETIVEQRRTFIAGLVDECMEVMGPPPCKYAMIGLGSQATGLATPYSDLEFAILVEEETDDNYFRYLTHYLHLKVINLRETILPAMGIKSLNDFFSDDPLDNWFYDSVTPRGFAFDGAMPHACKTPLGRGTAGELIHTPVEMARVLADDLTLHLKKGYHLASILGNVCFITGEQDLVNTYADFWTMVVQRTRGLINSLQAQMAFDENAEMLTFQTITSSLVNVKKEIYRFSTIAVSCWALFHNIRPTTIWETIEKMQKNGVISSEDAHHLMVLVSISAELRLRTYMNSRGQVENMSALSSMSTDRDIDEALQKVFYFSNIKQLMRYYNTAIPLKRLFDVNQEEPSVLFDSSPDLQRQVYESVCDYTKMKTCAENAVQEAQQRYGKDVAHPEIGRLLQNLGVTCVYLGDHKAAVTYLEQSLEMKQSVYGENTAHPEICASLHNLGAAWVKLGDPGKAIKYFEQTLQMQRSIHGEDTKHPDIAVSLGSLGGAFKELGDHRKAIIFHEQALQMRRSIYGEDTAHPNIAVSLQNLGAAWGDLNDHRKSLSYFQQSLKMLRTIYGENTVHPDIAGALGDVGHAWTKLGDYRKAISHGEQALQMGRIIHSDTPHPDIASSLHSLGDAWKDLGDHRKAVSCYEQSLQMRRTIYGEDGKHINDAILLSSLGFSLGKLGELRKAISIHEQSLQMYQSIHGEDTAHPDIAYSLHNLGGAWSHLGEHRKAVRYGEQALRMRRGIYGEHTAHSDTVGSLYNLGLYWSHLGDHRKAVSCFEQSLQMELSVHGEGTAHPDIAKSLNGLGIAWRNLGNHRKAVSYHEQSLQMRRSIYGEHTADPLTAESLYNLGVAWSDLGDQRKAIGYLQQALKMRQTIHGKNTPHPDIALSLSSMGSAWYKLGDNKEARPYFKQSLQMYRSVHGENTTHTDIARVLNDLGVNSYYLGDHRKAVSYHQQALQMRRSIHGEGTEHPDIAASLLNFGAAWAELGDHEKAISHLEQSLQMHRSIHGEDTAHPDIADSLHNLGLAWSKIGDHRKATSYHEQSLQKRRRIFGENTAHPKTAESLVSLGKSWSDLGDHRKAVGFYQQALQMRRGIHGEDTAHPDVASSLNNLGIAWHDLGDYRKAIRYYEQSLQMRRNIYGKDTAHTDIAISLSNLGIAWNDLGDHRTAIGYHEQALQMRRSLHGRNTSHPDIVGTLGSLGNAWRKLGDYRKAVSYYEQALKMRRSIHGENAAHPKIAATFDNLGAAWSQLGHHRKAVSYAEQALQMRKTLYGENTAHPHIANSLGNLSVAWRNLGDQRKGLINEDEKEVVQHRIRYAEKCMKCVYSPNYTKAEIELTVAEILHGVEKKAKGKGRDVIAIMEGYTDAFVDSIVDRNERLQVDCLKTLGDLYLEKGRVGRDEAAFTTAAGLYRAALDRCEESDGRETLKHRIKYVEKVKGKAEKRREKPTGNSKADYAKWLVPPSTACKPALDVISQINKKRIAGADSHMNNKTPADTERTYQEHLQEGCRALQTGDLDIAEEHFAAALKDVHRERKRSTRAQ
uniref:Uncharacterized protein n=1 Tax=Branchiostoma floridae TaxID=7739 RepID=C4A0Y5_BRAFL|eukprot:XP_002585539.1 hypothetical protein BRAFLDRAFT_111892 [Branchiostoma floridae]